MKKLADDSLFLGQTIDRAISLPPLGLDPKADALRAHAALMTRRLREQEEYRMSQTVENLGGPGSARSRYQRMAMTNPYKLHPMMPYAVPPYMHGVDHSAPGAADMQEAGVGDAELGFTRTASIRMQAMHEELQKIADGEGYDYADDKQFGPDRAPMYNPQYGSPYHHGMNMFGYPPPHASVYENPSQQYLHAGQPQLQHPPQQQEAPTHLQTAASSAGNALKHFGTGLGETGKAIGYGTAGVLGALGKGAKALFNGTHQFMSQEAQGNQRWGTGTPPASMTNEYGQPIYG